MNFVFSYLASNVSDLKLLNRWGWEFLYSCFQTNSPYGVTETTIKNKAKELYFNINFNPMKKHVLSQQKYLLILYIPPSFFAILSTPLALCRAFVLEKNGATEKKQALRISRFLSKQFLQLKHNRRFFHSTPATNKLTRRLRTDQL